MGGGGDAGEGREESVREKGEENNCRVVENAHII